MNNIDPDLKRYKNYFKIINLFSDKEKIFKDLCNFLKDGIDCSFPESKSISILIPGGGKGAFSLPFIYAVYSHVKVKEKELSAKIYIVDLDTDEHSLSILEHFLKKIGTKDFTLEFFKKEKFYKEVDEYFDKVDKKPEQEEKSDINLSDKINIYLYKKDINLFLNENSDLVFDLVYAPATFHHLDKPVSFINNLYKSLKKSAKLITIQGKKDWLLLEGLFDYYTYTKEDKTICKKVDNWKHIFNANKAPFFRSFGGANSFLEIEANQISDFIIDIDSKYSVNFDKISFDKDDLRFLLKYVLSLAKSNNAQREIDEFFKNTLETKFTLELHTDFILYNVNKDKDFEDEELSTTEKIIKKCNDDLIDFKRRMYLLLNKVLHIKIKPQIFFEMIIRMLNEFQMMPDYVFGGLFMPFYKNLNSKDLILNSQWFTNKEYHNSGNNIYLDIIYNYILYGRLNENRDTTLIQAVNKSILPHLDFDTLINMETFSSIYSESPTAEKNDVTYITKNNDTDTLFRYNYNAISFAAITKPNESDKIRSSLMSLNKDKNNPILANEFGVVCNYQVINKSVRKFKYAAEFNKYLKEVNEDSFYNTTTENSTNFDFGTNNLVSRAMKGHLFALKEDILTYGIPINIYYDNKVNNNLFLWLHVDKNKLFNKFDLNYTLYKDLNKEDDKDKIKEKEQILLSVEKYIMQVLKPIVERFMWHIAYWDLNEKEKQTRSQEARKSAVAAIMGRNMSHNLGSHVLDILKNNITEKEFYNSHFYHLSNSKFADTSDFNTVNLFKNLKEYFNKLAKKDNPVLSFSILHGVKHLISYLKDRQEYIAALSNFEDHSSTSINFYYDILLNLFPHRNDNIYMKYTKLNNYIFNYIAKSDEYVFENNPLDKDDKKNEKNLMNLIVKNDSTFTTLPGENSNDSAENYEKDLKNINVSLPAGFIGRQAIYSILENFVRNSAKHGNLVPKLNILFDFPHLNNIAEKYSYCNDDGIVELNIDEMKNTNYNRFKFIAEDAYIINNIHKFTLDNNNVYKSEDCYLTKSEKYSKEELENIYNNQRIELINDSGKKEVKKVSVYKIKKYYLQHEVFWDLKFDLKINKKLDCFQISDINEDYFNVDFFEAFQEGFGLKLIDDYNDRKTIELLKKLKNILENKGEEASKAENSVGSLDSDLNDILFHVILRFPQKENDSTTLQKFYENIINSLKNCDRYKDQLAEIKILEELIDKADNILYSENSQNDESNKNELIEIIDNYIQIIINKYKSNLKNIFEGHLVYEYDPDKYYKTTLSANNNSYWKHSHVLHSGLEDELIDPETFSVKSANKGLKEMKISAAWLRGINLAELDTKEFFPNLFDIRCKDTKIKCSKSCDFCDELNANFEFVFYMLKPKEIIFILSDINYKYYMDKNDIDLKQLNKTGIDIQNVEWFKKYGADSTHSVYAIDSDIKTDIYKSIKKFTNLKSFEIDFNNIERFLNISPPNEIIKEIWKAIHQSVYSSDNYKSPSTNKKNIPNKSLQKIIFPEKLKDDLFPIIYIKDTSQNKKNNQYETNNQYIKFTKDLPEKEGSFYLERHLKLKDKDQKILENLSYAEGVSGGQSFLSILHSNIDKTEFYYKMLFHFKHNIIILDERIYNNAKDEKKSSLCFSRIFVYNLEFKNIDFRIVDSYKNNKQKISINPEWPTIISVHQGLLDKISDGFYQYDNTDNDFNNTSNRNNSNQSNSMYSQRYDKLVEKIKDKFFRLKDKEKNNKNKIDTVKFNPTRFVHSGRSKPEKEKTPQNTYFIQYSSLETALLDSKYSLCEQFLNSKK